MAELSELQPRRTDSEGQLAPTQLSLFRNIGEVTIYGGSFTINNNVQTICRNHGTTNHPPMFAFSPVRTSGSTDDIVTRGLGNQALSSLFSKIRRLICNLPAPHLALARDCASLVRRQTTSRDLGRNVVCVVAPCFASYLFCVLPAGLQPVVTYIWASTIVSHFLYPLGLDCKLRPVAQVTVVDALGNSLTFPWDACESITTFHEQYLQRSRNQPGFLFVKAKSYDVRYNGHILQQADWRTVQPFTELYVDFVIIQGEGTGVMCPWCQAVHSPPEGPSGDICTCFLCGRDFSVMNSLSAGSSNVVPVDDLRIREILRRSLSEAILRVRVKFQLPGRMPMGPTPAPPFINVPPSDSAPASLMSSGVNFSQPSLNEPIMTPMKVLHDYAEDEVLHSAINPESHSSIDEEEEPESDTYHDPPTFDDMDHEKNSSPSISGGTGETRPLPMVDRRAEQTGQTELSVTGERNFSYSGVTVADLASSVLHSDHQAPRLQDTESQLARYRHEMKPERHNIIVFGEADCGKSSVVNMIIGNAVAKVSNGFGGCTFQNEPYEADIDGTAFRIFDTAGLNEGDEDRVPHWKAVQGLYTLIRQLDGVSLLIFCIRGRIKANTRANWLLFNKVICGETVPAIAVVTGLEDEVTPDDWWRRQENKEVFRRYKLKPRGVACVVSVRGHKDQYRLQYQESQEKLRRLILNSYRREPWSKDKDAWFSRIYREVYLAGSLWPFTRKSKEFTTVMKNAVEEFAREAEMDEEGYEKLKRTLLQAEKVVEKAENRRRSKARQQMFRARS